VLALDFDGMREANAVSKSYELGGDVLIRAVGQARRWPALAGAGRRWPALAGEHAFVARIHTAGDGFAALMPGVNEAIAALRARTTEAQLDALDVPTSHQHVYHGASVGFATRHTHETPSQVPGRAIEAMHERKLIRRAKRTGDPPGLS